MDSVVREFERRYAYGEKCPTVRNFVNTYFIQGGKVNQKAKRKQRERILDKKIRVVELLMLRDAS